MDNYNKGFYKDLDTNFEQALELSGKMFTHEELIDLLKQGNIPQKQIAALKFDKVEDENDANVLVSNLTGCDGKIREAVALKINNLLIENPDLAKFFSQANVFADASIDINANICRLVIDSVAILKKDAVFTKSYIEKILNFINEAYQELDNFIFKDKKYVINKQLFKLYWCLEAIKLFVQEIPEGKLYEILYRASIEREYTIREKVAQIVKGLSDSKFDIIKKTLLNDENYYVRKALAD